MQVNGCTNWNRWHFSGENGIALNWVKLGDSLYLLQICLRMLPFLEKFFLQRGQDQLTSTQWRLNVNWKNVVSHLYRINPYCLPTLSSSSSSSILLFPSFSSTQRQFFLRTATPQQLHALVQIIYNVLTEKIPVSEEVRAKLRSHKDALVNLAQRNVPYKTKKRTLMQEGSGFIQELTRITDPCNMG